MADRTRTDDSIAPEVKVSAATLGAALSTILLYIVESAFGIDTPTAVDVAVVTLVVGVFGYVAPHTRKVNAPST